MAYNTNEFQVIAQGSLGGVERWSNTWTFLELSGFTSRQATADQVRALYAQLVARFHTSWDADGAIIRDLNTGNGEPADWEVVAGTGSTNLAPTQLATRISLDNLAGVRGGPFLSGYTISAIGAGGIVAGGVVTDLIDAVDTLASAGLNEGYQMRIDRPSVETTVAALRARVGARFDVIRSRANDTQESYTSTTL